MSARSRSTPKPAHSTSSSYVVVDDVGTVVNPIGLKGQIHGGVAQGLGQAVMEQVVYDRESGQMLTGSFMDYAMPRAEEIAGDLRSRATRARPAEPTGRQGRRRSRHGRRPAGRRQRGAWTRWRRSASNTSTCPPARNGSGRQSSRRAASQTPSCRGDAKGRARNEIEKRYAPVTRRAGRCAGCGPA